MTENNFNTLPDITNALKMTKQYEEYNFFRLWGLFLLIDSLIFLISLVPIFLITQKVYFIHNNPDTILRIGLHFIQYLLIFILLMKKGRSKKTSVKLGKIEVSFNWLFIGGLILIYLFRSFLNFTSLFFSFSISGYSYDLFVDVIILSLTTFLYYILMRKIIPHNDFKELRKMIFVLLGWLGVLLIFLPILKIDEFFNWDEISLSLSGPENYQSSGLFPIFPYIVSRLTNLIFLVCEFRSGMIAIKRSNEIIRKCGLKTLENCAVKIEDSLKIDESKLKILQDSIFSSTTRLTIMMILNANPQAGFTTLRKLLKITAGNMDHHTKSLETAGFLTKFKTFTFKQPMTVLKITDQGRIAFKTYSDILVQFLDHNKVNLE